MRRRLPHVLLPLFVAGSAAAQEPAPQRCSSGAISSVFIDNHSIFDTTDPDLDARFAWAYGLANSLHVRTRRGVLRRELLFGAGDCYDPVLLEESERLLRAHDFLARVDVFGIAQPDGSHHVIVDTQDAWSTQVDLRIGLSDGLVFEGARVREQNFLGTGQTLGLFYFERDVRRDYGFTYETPQFTGTRWDLELAAGRTRAGTMLEQVVAYPFVGEVGRVAARQSWRREDRFFDYIADDRSESRTHVLLPLRDKALELSGLARLGRRGNLTVLGAAVGYQELTYPGAIEMVHGDDFDAREPADSALAAPVAQQTSALKALRVFALLGQRGITWIKRRGLDSFRGEQDVRLGAEAELAFGRSLSVFGTDTDDLFASLNVYSGFEASNVLGLARVRADGRRDLSEPAHASEWEDLIVQGELLGYWRPSAPSRHTLLVRGAAAGGWHTRTPFQLTLGGDRAVRGYAPHDFPGGRRFVLSLEDRVYFGWPLRDVLDLGSTTFLDVGRIWPGDAPFGRDSGWRAAVGLGLRAAFPAGGRTIYRLDAALPVEGGGVKRLRLMLSVGELLGVDAAFQEPQLLRSRQATLSGELFHFRN